MRKLTTDELKQVYGAGGKRSKGSGGDYDYGCDCGGKGSKKGSKKGGKKGSNKKGSNKKGSKYK